MAIQLYCGLPGSGKSYGVVENVVVKAASAGRPIYTNLPLFIEKIITDFPMSSGLITCVDNATVNGDWLMSIPGGSVIILDECWRFWPAGLKAININPQDKEFFAEHRHKSGEDGLTQEICLITQAPSQLAKVVRDLVDQTVIIRKNSAVGLDKTYNLDIYPGCAASLDRPGAPIMSGAGKYKPSVYQYYKSHTKAANDLPGIEKRADNRGRFYNHPFFKYVVPASILFGIWGFYKIHDITTNGFTHKPPTLQETPVQPQYQAAPQVATPETTRRNPPGPKPSVEWKIVGEMTIQGGDHIVYAQNHKKKMRKIGSQFCSFDYSGPTCVLGSEIVTRYTGPEEHDAILSVAKAGSQELFQADDTKK